jgi:hypothetical protein
MHLEMATAASSLLPVWPGDDGVDPSGSDLDRRVRAVLTGAWETSPASELLWC